MPDGTVLDVARMARGFVALNAAPAQGLPAAVVDRCDLVLVNEDEYGALSELSRARLVAVTYGSAGAAILRSGREVARCPAFAVDVASTVGAGDAFCAALTVAVLTGLADEVALRVACAVGAAAVASPDTQPPLQLLPRYVDVRNEAVDGA